MTTSSPEDLPPHVPADAARIGNLFLDAVIGQHAGEDTAINQEAFAVALDPLCKLRDELTDDDWDEYVTGISVTLLFILVEKLARATGVDNAEIVTNLREILDTASRPGGVYDLPTLM